MADKPKSASEYKSEQVRLARSTCLYVATKLGDLMDELVVVGGLVPSLLIDQGALPVGVPAGGTGTPQSPPWAFMRNLGLPFTVCHWCPHQCVIPSQVLDYHLGRPIQ